MSDPPIRSGNAIIDALFDICVEILLWLADVFGVSYYTINIWVFCIVWPIFTIVLIVLLIRQRRSIRKLEQDLEAARRSQTADRPQDTSAP